MSALALISPPGIHTVWPWYYAARNGIGAHRRQAAGRRQESLVRKRSHSPTQNAPSDYDGWTLADYDRHFLETRGIPNGTAIIGILGTAGLASVACRAAWEVLIVAREMLPVVRENLSSASPSRLRSASRIAVSRISSAAMIKKLESENEGLRKALSIHLVKSREKLEKVVDDLLHYGIKIGIDAGRSPELTAISVEALYGLADKIAEKAKATIFAEPLPAGEAQHSLDEQLLRVFMQRAMARQSSAEASRPRKTKPVAAVVTDCIRQLVRIVATKNPSARSRTLVKVATGTYQTVRDLLVKAELSAQDGSYQWTTEMVRLRYTKSHKKKLLLRRRMQSRVETKGSR